jgi:transposase
VIVESGAALAHRYRLLTSMPGVGLVLACTLLGAAARAWHNQPQTSRCI